MQVRPHRAVIDESGGCVGQRLAAMILPFSADAHVACGGGMLRDLQLMGYHPASCLHALQSANYSQERAVNWLCSHSAEVESVAVAMSSAACLQQPAQPVYVYSGDFFAGLSMFWNLGKISKQDMACWVNRRNGCSGYTLLHQVRTTALRFLVLFVVLFK
jgi:hypothetical protein